MEGADDAGVYRISDDLAMIQTVDFFTPIVDDPYWFGKIAAANALSDVYAMGGVPKTALNLVAFPLQSLDIDVLRQILAGGIETLETAGTVLIGGHSIEDNELKYGLSVTGFIHPDRILTKTGMKAGDRLVLTKPLGTGVISTAIKAGLAPPVLVDSVTRLMAQLNRRAAEIMTDYAVHACTDITGFGLIGHLSEMVVGSGCSAVVDTARVPVIAEALSFADMGLIPAGAFKNKSFREGMVHTEPGVPRSLQDLLYDPQTSGGLLISVARADVQALESALRAAGIQAACMGEVTDRLPERIYVQ